MFHIGSINRTYVLSGCQPEGTPYFGENDMDKFVLYGRHRNFISWTKGISTRVVVRQIFRNERNDFFSHFISQLHRVEMP